MEIHNFITHKIAESESARAVAKRNDTLHDLKFHQGKLQELYAVRSFVDKHFNLTTQSYY